MPAPSMCIAESINRHRVASSELHWSVGSVRHNSDQALSDMRILSQDMEWVEPLHDTPEARKAASESVDILAAWVSIEMARTCHNVD